MTKITEKDLHVHSQFCPHRYSEEPFEAYLSAAEDKGLREISFTEHLAYVVPISLMQYRKFPTEVAIQEYFQALQILRDTYKGPVNFNIGLEVDYIENYEDKTAQYLDKVGPMMEDGLISVHNLYIGGKYHFVASEEFIPGAVEAAGGEIELCEIYYQTLIKSIEADLGPHKPVRVAHPTLLRLCRKQFPLFETKLDIIDEFVRISKEKGYTLELNTQGLIKNLCQEIYGEPLLPYIRKYDVPVALASDAHTPKNIAFGFDNPAIVENLNWLRPCGGR